PSPDRFERRAVNITAFGLQHSRWVRWSDAVVPPRGERREEWWIFAKLAQALGLRSALDAGDEPDLWGRIDHMLASRGTSLAAVREAPHGVAFEDGLETGGVFR